MMYSDVRPGLAHVCAPMTTGFNAAEKFAEGYEPQFTGPLRFQIGPAWVTTTVDATLGSIMAPGTGGKL
jgi:hypothetical protein